jgi:hypothetical protein
MPLATLQLAENRISVAQAVELVAAVRMGAPFLKELDLSGNPVCGVEGGGRACPLPSPAPIPSPIPSPNPN